MKWAILVVGTAIPPVMGGLEVYTWELSRHLAKRGHQVTLFGYQSIKESPLREEREGVDIVRFPNLSLVGNKMYWIQAIRKAQELYPQKKWQICHAQTAAPAGVVGGWLKKKQDVPLFITSHGYELIVRARQPWVTPFIRFAFHQANAVIGVSEELAQLSIQYGSPPEHTHIWANCVDTERFHSQIDGTALRRQFGWNKDDVVLLCLRRLEPKTGIQFVIQLIPELSTACPKLKFLIVGDGPMRKAWETQCSDHQSVYFTGSIANEEVPQYIATADLAVFPSLAEATSIAALEIMACEKPVVASDVGGLPEIIQNGRTGLLVPFEKTTSQYTDRKLPDHSLQALKTAILELALHPEKRSTMGQQARLQVETKYAWNTYINRLENLYGQS